MSSPGPQVPGATIDLRACVAAASPQWKLVGVTLDLKWDGKVLSLNKCTPVDLSPTGSPSGDACGTLAGPFPSAPGWEELGAKGAPICRHSATTRLGDHSLTCMYYPPPPPRSPSDSMTPFAPGVTEGGIIDAIPVLPGATAIVVYDQPCRGEPADVFSNVPLARFTLR
ncbi:MAG: hypothetical protein ACHREM_01315 [Polyangiales bacterium]